MRLVRSLVALVLATTLAAQQPASAEPGPGWKAAWSAAPQRPGVNFTPNWSEQGFAGQTLRQVVRITVPGAAVRIRLTNVYGTAPLTVSAATVARASGGAAVKTRSLRRLTSGRAATSRSRNGVVLFGDSLTDGYGSTPGADNRYPDELAERLAAARRPRAVLNQGIGGNRLTVDSAWLGDRATARFDRDVLGRPGVGTVIVLLGVNDIGMSVARQPLAAPHTEVPAAEIIAAHRELIRRARAKGLRVIGGTIPPMKGSRYHTPLSETKRDEVNAWIRGSGEYDAVADFDRALASPADEDQLDPAYDSGDHLHPGDAGYRAMADAVDLAGLG